jgi:NAD(P)-dependent dehydrogenase (short-subunit alcohol dehydrogenase family)
VNPPVALVTGAAGAIGGAICAALVIDGWVVIAGDRAAVRVDGTCPDAARLATLTFDITDEAAVDDAIARIVEDHGRLDAVVNNAGVVADAPLHTMSLEAFRKVVQVNLEGTFLVTRAALGHMRGRSGGGRIVNISSMSARLGNFGQANYAASKAGVLGLTRVTAREGARYGITANAVLPGFIDTPMTASLGKDMIAARVATIPLGRPGAPVEVAEAVRWLCSPAAGYVTGTTVEVAGGRGL